MDLEDLRHGKASFTGGSRLVMLSVPSFGRVSDDAAAAAAAGASGSTGGRLSASGGFVTPSGSLSISTVPMPGLATTR